MLAINQPVCELGNGMDNGPVAKDALIKQLEYERMEMLEQPQQQAHFPRLRSATWTVPKRGKSVSL
jgi:hypothetical protein